MRQQMSRQSNLVLREDWSRRVAMCLWNDQALRTFENQPYTRFFFVNLQWNLLNKFFSFVISMDFEAYGARIKSLWRLHVSLIQINFSSLQNYLKKLLNFSCHLTSRLIEVSQLVLTMFCMWVKFSIQSKWKISRIHIVNMNFTNCFKLSFWLHRIYFCMKRKMCLLLEKNK